ncbi:hypothetical protein K493DRAFT_312755 [Basidiobolus meristosporus CBS 931.73]|uniref:Uncharacterized protein n=1 Tax=Basidiobolus meristosporus CBS 931.73 TaxID=1314790 RepID=A0A1Y1YRG3_9FUNG|nr:hypothetical protein K493DRAFT_312755 [Basidiobolus meristosporus CBS 931.73]|eukprot:ORY00620.1 hypothetical protein K493DRAFT_312755 [Basidiobolus meristosporus CBS 931.73]
MYSSAIITNNSQTTVASPKQDLEEELDDPMELDEDNNTPVIPEYALRRRGAIAVVDKSVQSFFATRIPSGN